MNEPEERRDYSLRNFPIDLAGTFVYPMVLGFLLMGSLSISSLPTVWLWVAAFSFSLASAGAVMLLIAKWPLYRRGRFLTVGKRGLPPSSHRLYDWGCRCSLTGCALLALLLVASAFSIWGLANLFLLC